ncbi:twin-arginine translocase subunit TatC [Thermodesulfobacteriota bacterium]
MNEDGERMSFFSHLEELRHRLLRVVLAIIAGFIVCFFFSKQLLDFLTKPLSVLLKKPMVFTDLPEPFFVYLKISFVAGVFLVIPIILYQLWKFIAPGLYSKERKLALPFVMVATSLFYVGGAFAYFLVFPVIFNFFLAFQDPDKLEALPRLKEYVTLILKLMLAFGIVFELPIILTFLGLLGVVNSQFLARGRRYFIVIAFVIGALLSPPDVFSQLLMGVPLLILYEVSICIIRLIEKRRDARDKREELESAEEDL